MSALFINTTMRVPLMPRKRSSKPYTVVLNWSLLRKVISMSTPTRVCGMSGSSDRLRGGMKLALPVDVVHLRSRAGKGRSKPLAFLMRSLKFFWQVHRNDRDEQDDHHGKRR